MIDRLDGAAALAATLRAQVSSLRRTSSTTARQREAQQGPATDLASLLAARLKHIEADDPDRKRKAVRAFLEAVLLAELGPQIGNDPGFARMVDDVHQQMLANASLAQPLEDAATALLGPSP
jgi:hypothetical protein